VLTLLFLPALYAAWFRVPRPSEARAQDPEESTPSTPAPRDRGAAQPPRDGLEDLRPAE
jgi:hypothetical protein